MDEDPMICRICFGVINENVPFTPIVNNSVVLQNLNLIAFATIRNLQLTEDPLICGSCLSSLKDFAFFKENVITNEFKIQCHQKKDYNSFLKTLSPDTDCICRLCLKTNSAGPYFTKSWKDSKKMFVKCNIHLNLHILKPSRMCDDCFGILDKMYKFVCTSIERENEIVLYFTTHRKILESKDLFAVFNIIQKKLQQKDLVEDETREPEPVLLDPKDIQIKIKRVGSTYEVEDNNNKEGTSKKESKKKSKKRLKAKKKKKKKETKAATSEYGNQNEEGHSTNDSCTTIDLTDTVSEAAMSDNLNVNSAAMDTETIDLTQIENNLTNVKVMSEANHSNLTTIDLTEKTSETDQNTQNQISFTTLPQAEVEKPEVELKVINKSPRIVSGAKKSPSVSPKTKAKETGTGNVWNKTPEKSVTAVEAQTIEIESDSASSPKLKVDSLEAKRSPRIASRTNLTKKMLEDNNEKTINNNPSSAEKERKVKTSNILKYTKMTEPENPTEVLADNNLDQEMLQISEFVSKISEHKSEKRSVGSQTIEHGFSDVYSGSKGDQNQKDGSFEDLIRILTGEDEQIPTSSGNKVDVQTEATVSTGMEKEKVKILVAAPPIKSTFEENVISTAVEPVKIGNSQKISADKEIPKKGNEKIVKSVAIEPVKTLGKRQKISADKEKAKEEKIEAVCAAPQQKSTRIEISTNEANDNIVKYVAVESVKLLGKSQNVSADQEKTNEEKIETVLAAPQRKSTRMEISINEANDNVVEYVAVKPVKPLGKSPNISADQEKAEEEKIEAVLAARQRKSTRVELSDKGVNDDIVKTVAVESAKTLGKSPKISTDQEKVKEEKIEAALAAPQRKSIRIERKSIIAVPLKSLGTSKKLSANKEKAKEEDIEAVLPPLHDTRIEITANEANNTIVKSVAAERVKLVGMRRKTSPEIEEEIPPETTQPKVVKSVAIESVNTTGKCQKISADKEKAEEERIEAVLAAPQRKSTRIEINKKIKSEVVEPVKLLGKRRKTSPQIKEEIPSDATHSNVVVESVNTNGERLNISTENKEEIVSEIVHSIGYDVEEKIAALHTTPKRKSTRIEVSNNKVVAVALDQDDNWQKVLPDGEKGILEETMDFKSFKQETIEAFLAAPKRKNRRIRATNIRLKQMKNTKATVTAKPIKLGKRKLKDPKINLPPQKKQKSPNPDDSIFDFTEEEPEDLPPRLSKCPKVVEQEKTHPMKKEDDIMQLIKNAFEFTEEDEDTDGQGVQPTDDNMKAESSISKTVKLPKKHVEQSVFILEGKEMPIEKIEIKSDEAEPILVDAKRAKQDLQEAARKRIRILAKRAKWLARKKLRAEMKGKGPVKKPVGRPVTVRPENSKPSATARPKRLSKVDVIREAEKSDLNASVALENQESTPANITPVEVGKTERVASRRSVRFADTLNSDDGTSEYVKTYQNGISTDGDLPIYQDANNELEEDDDEDITLPSSSPKVASLLVGKPSSKVIKVSMALKRKRRSKKALEAAFDRLKQGLPVPEPGEEETPQTVKVTQAPFDKRPNKPRDVQETLQELHSLFEETPNKMFECVRCAYKTRSLDMLNQHKLIHTVLDSVQKFKCQLCSFQCKTKEQIDAHNLSHQTRDPTENFACMYCDFRSKKKSSLMHHILLHTNEVSRDEFYSLVVDFNEANVESTKCYECLQCDVQTEEVAEMHKHIQTHDMTHGPPQMFNCRFCTYKTKGEELLRVHESSAHAKQLKRRQCKLCRFRTKNNEELRKHEEEHAAKGELTLFEPGSQEYRCIRCEYVTLNKRSMSNHIGNKHNESRRKTKPAAAAEVGREKKKQTYRCAHCSYTTTRKVNMTRHALVHKTKKNMLFFECSHCPFETKHRRSYTRHMEILHKVFV